MRKFIQLFIAAHILSLAPYSLAEVIFNNPANNYISYDPNPPFELQISVNNEAKNYRIITVRGPLRDYAVVKRIKRYGVWSSTPAIIVKDIPSYYNVISNANMLEEIATDENISKFMFKPELYIHNKNFTEAERVVYKKLVDSGLYKQTVLHEVLNQRKPFSYIFKVPHYLKDGEYAITYYEFNNLRQFMNNISFNQHIVKKDKYWIIKYLSLKHPIIYTSLIVFIAISFGFVAGIRKNAARQR